MRLVMPVRHAHVAVIMLTSLALMACGDSPTDTHGDEPEPHGLIISLAGSPLVIVDDLTVTGSLSVSALQETSDLLFVFTDHDGEPITAGLTEYFLDATIDDTGIALFHATADFEAHVEGLSVGSTTIQIHFMHPPGPTAHSNYDSPLIDITVTP